MLPQRQTARLTLVPASQADLDAFCGLLTDPAVRLYLRDDARLARGQVSELLDAYLALARESLGPWTLRTQGGDWIGCVGLRSVCASLAAPWPELTQELGPVVALVPQAWGQGYATEALEAAVAYAFEGLGRHRLVALVDEPNTRSHRLMQRVGFVPVGAGPGPKYALRAFALKGRQR